MAKHGTERCDLGPAKGLGDDELLELASLGEIQLSQRRLSFSNENVMGDLAALLNKQAQKEDNILFNTSMLWQIRFLGFIILGLF